MNKWTFENKYMLLQAELHYLNQDYKAAGDAYLASIECANAHKFTHEEAMAYELFGVFCLENERVEEGANISMQQSSGVQRVKQLISSNSLKFCRIKSYHNIL